jgi:hypothetical protein
MKCSHCQTETSNEAQFCPVCGAPFSPPLPHPARRPKMSLWWYVVTVVLIAVLAASVVIYFAAASSHDDNNKPTQPTSTNDPLFEDIIEQL